MMASMPGRGHLDQAELGIIGLVAQEFGVQRQIGRGRKFGQKSRQRLVGFDDPHPAVIADSARKVWALLCMSGPRFCRRSRRRRNSGSCPPSARFRMVRTPFGPGADRIVCRRTATSAPPAKASAITRPFSLPLAGRSSPIDVRQGRRDIGIGDRRRIGIAGFEIGPDGGHEVAGLGPAEAAMIALAGGERRVTQRPPCIAAHCRSRPAKLRKLT